MLGAERQNGEMAKWNIGGEWILEAQRKKQQMMQTQEREPTSQTAETKGEASENKKKQIKRTTIAPLIRWNNWNNCTEQMILPLAIENTLFSLRLSLGFVLLSRVLSIIHFMTSVRRNDSNRCFGTLTVMHTARRWRTIWSDGVNNMLPTS